MQHKTNNYKWMLSNSKANGLTLYNRVRPTAFRKHSSTPVFEYYFQFNSGSRGIHLRKYRNLKGQLGLILTHLLPQKINF